MKYEIVTYGKSVLREKAQPIEDITADIRKLADDMLETMYASNGVGLAAQQIGLEIAICVVDVPPAQDRRPETGERENPDVEMPLVLLNPVIIESTSSHRSEEGCLSIPDIVAPIKRAKEVTVEFLDLNGARRSIRAKGLLARAVQHELDHLNGMLVVDRMSLVKKAAISGKLKKMKKEAQ